MPLPMQPPQKLLPQRHNSAGSSGSGSGSGSGGSPPSDEQSTIRNWRQDCVYARNCGMNQPPPPQQQQHQQQNNRSTAQRAQQQPRIGSGRFAHLQAAQLMEELPDMRIGLSPPSESVLLQRRLRQQQRANDLSEYCEPATASG